MASITSTEHNHEITSNLVLETTNGVTHGTEFILRHFREPILPRRIYTPIQKQITVYNLGEIFRYFGEANFIDCRISAYHYLEDLCLTEQLPPDVIFIDLDKSHFKSNLALDRAINKTLKNIRRRFDDDNIRPTVSWSGNGYHIIQPIDAINLKGVDIFKDFRNQDLNRQFMQFVEPFLSDNRADPEHYHNVSFNNCLLRVPGSFNSKLIGQNYNLPSADAEIRVMQEWNGVRPDIRLVLGDFHAYLVDEREKLRQERRYTYQNNSDHILPTTISWIETLLQTPIDDGRKRIVFRVLAPYLITIKKISYQDSFNIIKNWLDKCRSIVRLQNWSDRRIRDYLDNVAGYYPISFDKLKTEDRELYELLNRGSN